MKKKVQGGARVMEGLTDCALLPDFTAPPTCIAYEEQLILGEEV